MFVESFIDFGCVKELMHTIEECQALQEFDLVFYCTQILATIFKYQRAIESIKKKKQGLYFAKCFELSNINEGIKKQVIRIFLQFASQIADCFSEIEKAAINYARESESIPF